ncbi:MAG: gliding motility protein GldN [Bacteroidales bacterium]|nr:gliding motility protein GldN [Bacteroidales bacterium]
MKFLKLIIAVVAITCTASVASAQVVKKTSEADKKKKEQKQVSARQQSFYEVPEPSDADLQWKKIVYRELDLTKGKNAALYYPEEPNEDGESLFYIIMRHVANGEVNVYEWLDGREMFTDTYKYKVSAMLDRFHILYAHAKGSTEKAPKYVIENADIPGSEVLSYYIIEKWEFDTRSNKMRSRVDAICPVLHREDEFGVVQKWPMFWVKLNDIRPYIAQQFVFTDNDNNLLRYNLDDFFKLNMYTGDIYKVKNLRNQTLRQQFPDEKAYKHAQDSIERRLRQFDKGLWVPSREELQAQKEAKEKAEREANGETEEEKTEATEEKKKSVKKSTTKRGSASSADKKESKPKTKTAKVKTREVKSSGGATRSVRNRKK